MGPEEHAWLPEHKLKNAADVVQDTGTDFGLWPDLHLGLVKLPLRFHSMWMLRLRMQLLQHLLSSRRSVGDLLSNVLRTAASVLHASSI